MARKKNKKGAAASAQQQVAASFTQPQVPASSTQPQGPGSSVQYATGNCRMTPVMWYCPVEDVQLAPGPQTEENNPYAVRARMIGAGHNIPNYPALRPSDLCPPGWNPGDKLPDIEACELSFKMARQMKIGETMWQVDNDEALGFTTLQKQVVNDLLKMMDNSLRWQSMLLQLRCSTFMAEESKESQYKTQFQQKPSDELVPDFTLRLMSLLTMHTPNTAEEQHEMTLAEFLRRVYLNSHNGGNPGVTVPDEAGTEETPLEGSSEVIPTEESSEAIPIEGQEASGSTDVPDDQGCDSLAETTSSKDPGSNPTAKEIAAQQRKARYEAGKKKPWYQDELDKADLPRTTLPLEETRRLLAEVREEVEANSNKSKSKSKSKGKEPATQQPPTEPEIPEAPATPAKKKRVRGKYADIPPEGLTFSAESAAALMAQGVPMGRPASAAEVLAQIHKSNPMPIPLQPQPNVNNLNVIEGLTQADKGAILDAHLQQQTGNPAHQYVPPAMSGPFSTAQPVDGQPLTDAYLKGSTRKQTRAKATGKPARARKARTPQAEMRALAPAPDHRDEQGRPAFNSELAYSTIMNAMRPTLETDGRTPVPDVPMAVFAPRFYRDQGQHIYQATGYYPPDIESLEAAVRTHVADNRNPGAMIRNVPQPMPQHTTSAPQPGSSGVHSFVPTQIPHQQMGQRQGYQDPQQVGQHQMGQQGYQSPHQMGHQHGYHPHQQQMGGPPPAHGMAPQPYFGHTFGGPPQPGYPQQQQLPMMGPYQTTYGPPPTPGSDDTEEA